MQTFRGFRTLVAAAALVAGLAACSGSGADKAGGTESDKPIVLTLAVLDSDYAAEQFTEAVRRESGGSMRIAVRAGSPSLDTIDDVRRGRSDLGDVAVRAWESVGVTSFRALLAPMLVDNLELQRRVVESPLAPRMLAGVEPLGVVGLALLPGPLLRPLGVTRPLLGPEDYEGARIGIKPGLAGNVFAVLGATTEDFSPVPGSISRLDGVEVQLRTIEANRYDLDARALTANVAFRPRTEAIFMNRGRFERLSPAQREVLRRAGRAAVQPALARIRADEAGALATVCGAGHVALVHASANELAGLRAAVQPLYAELRRDAATRRLLAGIRKLRGTRRSGATDGVRCPSTTPAETNAAELEGVWRLSLTRQELLDAGFTREEAEPYVGGLTLALRRGRFELQLLRNGQEAWGRYRIRGRVLEHEVVSCRPVDICTEGAVGSFGWSVYRDRLTFERIPGRPGEKAMTVKPLTRVG